MKQNDSGPITHVFICQTCTLEGDGVAAEPGAGVLFRNRVKQLAAARWGKNAVRINASGCLGLCAKGINCVIYPQGRWVTNMKAGDELELIKIIAEIHEKERVTD